jgi:ribonuclease BN (tRNA processing enzyme)
MSVYVVDKSPLGEVRKVSTHLGYLVHYAVFLKEDELNAHSFHSTLTDARKKIGKEINKGGKG